MPEWISEFIGWFNAPRLQAILTFVGISIATISVVSVKATAKKKQTAEYLMELRSDARLEKCIQRLRQLDGCENTNMLTLGLENKADDKDAQDLRYLLNHFERLSVGIQEKIYDEKMVKKSQYSTFVKTYERSQQFIRGVRKTSPTAYQEFEWLSLRWQKNPLKSRKKLSAVNT